MAEIINGKEIALEIQRNLKQKVSKLPSQPGLAIILIGDDPASRTYVELKEKAAKEVGIFFQKFEYSASIKENEIIELVKKLNADKRINGILVQFPLPAGLKKENILATMSAEKDVDGFKPENIEALLKGQAVLVPGLAEGILKLIQSTRINLANKKAVVIARSRIFIDPLAYLLAKEGIVTTACQPDDKACVNTSLSADILVAAVGKPGFVASQMVKPGAIIIDVGYSHIDRRAVGDVDFESVNRVAGWLTPVPGGVGPMTVAMLLNNVVKAYEN